MTAIECDCEPTIYDDGSKGHEIDCAAFPWCPHEVCAYACLMPCGCPCDRCQLLTAANGPTEDQGGSNGQT